MSVIGEQQAPAGSEVCVASSVVVVVDLQRAYFDPSVSAIAAADAPAVALRIDKFLSDARLRGIPVLWTRMTEDAEHAPHNLRPLRAGPPIAAPGTPAFAFAGPGPEAGERIIDKVHLNAFSNAELAGVFDSPGRDTIILVGGLAGRCVLATAFGAAEKGLDVWVVSDLLAAHRNNPGELRVALAILATTTARVASAEQIVQRWR